MTTGTSEVSEWQFPNRATPVGSPRYYAVRFSPAAQRECNARLIAWYEVIEAIVDRPLDPGVARLKLEWWREELARTAQGQARHPLAVALQPCSPGERMLHAMQSLVDVAEAGLAEPQPGDDAAFAAACRRSFGGFFRILAARERPGSRDLALCTEAGAYCAAVERVRNLGRAPHRVPATLRPAAVARMSTQQRSERFEPLFGQFSIDRVADERGLPDLARKLTALAGALHEKMRNRGYPVADTLIDRAPVTHLWTAWRCR